MLGCSSLFWTASTALLPFMMLLLLYSVRSVCAQHPLLSTSTLWSQTICLAVYLCSLSWSRFRGLLPKMLHFLWSLSFWPFQIPQNFPYLHPAPFIVICQSPPNKWLECSLRHLSCQLSLHLYSTQIGFNWFCHIDMLLWLRLPFPSWSPQETIMISIDPPCNTIYVEIKQLYSGDSTGDHWSMHINVG